MNTKTFSAKILFFGEHTLIKGSKGLLFPYQKLSGKLVMDLSLDFEKIQNLIDFFQNSPLIKENLDIDALKNDVKKGLSFDSTIVQGQGLGSSGALTSALLWAYGKSLPKKENYTENELALLKDVLALMESFYHGSSSGMDPLVSYVGKPILVESKNKLRQIELPSLSGNYKYFLLPTNIERKASPLIHRFLHLCDKEKITKADLENLIKATNNCVDSFLTQNEEALYENFHALSKLQYLHLAEMIPESLHKVWFKALEHREFLLKICGAGGGGYFMGMAPKEADLSSLGTTISVF